MTTHKWIIVKKKKQQKKIYKLQTMKLWLNVLKSSGM